MVSVPHLKARASFATAEGRGKKLVYIIYELFIVEKKVEHIYILDLRYAQTAKTTTNNPKTIQEG
jgi:hypothetical protein